MRIIILTSIARGPASRVLPALCDNEKIEVVKVVLAHGGSPNRKRNLKRKINKVRKIGLLGALNGIRMRNWYADKDAEDIRSVCKSLDIDLSGTPFINSKRTKDLFRDAKADLGISLGNGYIPKSVFSIPEHGMLNIHTEILPKYQGAQSIIWPICNMERKTGFSIHQIDSKIDTGDILFQDEYQIRFMPTLKDTVEENIHTAWDRIPEAFSHVCANYQSIKKTAKSQGHGNSHTTPSIRQYFQMVRNHRVMYKESLKDQS